MATILVWILTHVAPAAEPAASARFSGLIQRVEVLGDAPHLPIDVDPRFAVTLLVLQGTVAPPFVVGQPITFGIHSPARTFAGEPVVGAVYAFDAALDPTVTPARITTLRVSTLGPVLPGTERTCAVDADCAVSLVHLDGPFTCCAGCGTSTAGTTAWARLVTEACRAAPTPNCYSLACPVGLTRAGCTSGVCTLTP